MKKALEKMMTDLKIPALIIRSMSLKAISALKDLGLKLSGDAEIDLMMAYVSGDFLHVVIVEVKRANTYPGRLAFLVDFVSLLYNFPKTVQSKLCTDILLPN